MRIVNKILGMCDEHVMRTGREPNIIWLTEKAKLQLREELHALGVFDTVYTENKFMGCTIQTIAEQPDIKVE